MDAAKKDPAQHQLHSELSVRWRGALIISIPVVCLLASIVAIAGVRSQTLEAQQEEQQSRQTLTATNRLALALVNAETGVRGYVITRREEFLEPYLEAKELLPQSLDSLKDQVKTDWAQHQQFLEILRQVQQQITLLEKIIETSDVQGATTGGSPTLSAQLLEAKSSRDKLLQEIEDLAAEEERWQRNRQAQVVRWRRLTNAVQWVALAGGVLSSGAALYLFNKLERELAKRESSLRASNIHLNAVFDNVVDGIIVLNQWGYVQSANTAAFQIFGYQAEQLLGSHLKRLLAEPLAADSGKVMSYIVGTNQDKLRRQQETLGRHQQGKTFPMEFTISEMQLDSEPLFIAIVRDITERKQWAETLLKQAQLLDLANDTILVRNLNDQITYWNQGAQRLYGFLSTQAVGQSVHTLLKTEFPQPLEEIKKSVFEKGYWHGELVHHKQDGTPVTVASGWTLQRDETGEPMAYLEIDQDITELKKSEIALRRSEEQYRTLAKNFPNGAVFLFDHQLRYSIAEGTGLAAVGLDGNSVAGKSIGETLAPEIFAELEPIYRSALAGKTSVTEVPFGTQFYRLHALPMKNETGEVFAGMVMTQDITQSKKHEAALKARAEELAKITARLAQTTAILKKKNSELDQFAYIVSHDLKAPLRAIANLSQWIEEDLEDKLTADTRHQMDLMRGRVHRMEALINGILQYSRVGRLQNQLSQVDIKVLLADVIDSLAPPPEFAVKVMPGMPKLVTERLPLEQVFTNLISNGIKHNHRQSGQIVISVTDKTEFYEFSVADDGPGIAPEFHEKIFVIFQTLEARDKIENTGVGLAIVKKIIEDKGGTISLESQPGQGATFRFTWPKQSFVRSS
ncbi:MAG: PAS domain S-box protein [Symploca sp. SIO3C6]|nr:PAS domain S-box protein [Symploca sp. SIO3C6]NET03853.1 PAS domain S-box protein [Symploca sp. SIO2B6]